MVSGAQFLASGARFVAFGAIIMVSGAEEGGAPGLVPNSPTKHCKPRHQGQGSGGGDRFLF